MQNIQNILQEAYLCFRDFVSGQFDHSEVSLAEGSDDLIEADLQRPGLGAAWLRARAAARHYNHDAGLCVLRRSDNFNLSA